MAKLDENPELILEPEQRITRSLDHQICAITLRPVTNHFANGYGVAVSAKFGVERLRLMIDDEEISFKFSIYKAEVILDRAKCDPDTQFTPDKTALVERKLSEAETHVHLNGGVGGVKHGHKWKSSYQFSKTDEALTIESCGSPKVPLRGQLLDEFVGWRVKPHLGVNSGVLGRVRVREEWIELVEPEHHAGPMRIFNKIKVYITGEGSDSESRRKKFSALLARLVSEALQDVTEVRDATLAMDTIIVRPEDEEALRLEGVPVPLLRLEGEEINSLITSSSRPKLLGVREYSQKTKNAEQIESSSSADTTVINAVISEIISRYLAKIDFIEKLSKSYGQDRIFISIYSAILPKDWEHSAKGKPLSIKDQRVFDILMRRREFENFLLLCSLDIAHFDYRISELHEWLRAKKGSKSYQIRIGDFLTFHFGMKTVEAFFDRHSKSVIAEIRERQTGK